MATYQRGKQIAKRFGVDPAKYAELDSIDKAIAVAAEDVASAEREVAEVLRNLKRIVDMAQAEVEYPDRLEAGHEHEGKMLAGRLPDLGDYPRRLIAGTQILTEKQSLIWVLVQAREELAKK